MYILELWSPVSQSSVLNNKQIEHNDKVTEVKIREKEKRKKKGWGDTVEIKAIQWNLAVFV